MQYRLALWLHNAIRRAFPLEQRFASEVFFERVRQSMIPSQIPDRGHWSCSLALPLAANGPLLAAEWASFLVEHVEAHPWVERVEVSRSGHINLFLTAEAFHEYWQPIWCQSLEKLASHEPLGDDCPKNDNLAYAKQRLVFFLRDLAAQYPQRYAELTAFSSDVSHWFVLQDEADWRFSGILLEVRATMECESIEHPGLKMHRLASALHNYYNALLVLAERKPVQKLRLLLLVLCFGILTADWQSLEKNG